MKKIKLIKDNSALPLKKLNESKGLKNPDKYIFEGVFTACSTPDHRIVNRNNRVYMKGEILKHLGYLRQTLIDNNGRLLGELDHPEGRFDVHMKDASHMITDLWYDESTNCVMGKLQVLDTPNGKILKTLIDAGFPLYVSSRAAGDVDEKTKEVSIALIFTYDVVCTPGFKEAKLERVDESLLTAPALKYLNESVSSAEDADEKDIEVPVSAINESLVNEYANVSVNDVNQPLFEDEEATEDANVEYDKDQQLNDDDASKYLRVMQGNEPINEEEAKEDESEEKDENSEENKSDEEDSEEKEENSEEKHEIKEVSDEEKEENRELIISITGFKADEEESEENTEESEENTEESEEESDKEESKESEEKEDKEKEEKEGSEDKEEKEEVKESEEAEDSNIDELNVNEGKNKASKAKKQATDDLADAEALLASIEKAESVKESIIRRYPFSISLSESNFAKFSALRPKLKKRCAEFIEEHNIFDIEAINEFWLTPLREDKKVMQNWLKLASKSDLDLYCAAPVEWQNAIEEQAQLFILETQEDVDNFWDKTGLRQAEYQRQMNEKLANDYRNSISENQAYAESVLGYNEDIIRMTEQWLLNN